MIILFLLIVFISICKECYSLNNRKFFSKLVISCKYNNKVLKGMINDKKKELILSENDKAKYSKVCLDNLSQSSTDELINFVKESTSQLIEINLEYLYFLSVVINMIINYYLAETINIKSKEEALRIFIKNILLPIMVHDLCKLIFDIIKEIKNSIN